MIRYNKELVNYVNKTVRNYNAKIRRLEKVNPSLALPEKITAKSIKNVSDTRKDLIRNLNKLKRFSKRGAENTIILPSGELISTYEISELKRESARLQRNLTKRINELGNTIPQVKGVKEKYTYAQMGDMRLNNMIAKRDTIKAMKKSFIKENKLKEFMKLLETTRNKQNYQISMFKNNFIDKMFGYEAYAIGYDEAKIRDIKAKLNKLSDRDFLKFFDTEKLIQQIRDRYVNINTLNIYAYKEYETEMTELFDELYENIDDLLKDYKSYKK